MKRNSMLKILNPIIAFLILNQAVTGTLHDAIPDEAYEFFHGGGGICLVIGVVLHVILNWNWIKASYHKKKSKA
jgi:hypothetical protein